MAIPAAPTNFFVQTANAEILASWDISAGATSYDVQRSTDNVTYASIATVAANQYLDTAVTLATQYFYKVAAINASGTSLYTIPQSAVPVTQGEMCLSQIRLASQQTADRVNSNFIELPEWNSFINLALFELYDLLVTVYEDYFMAIPITFTVNNTQAQYPLPDGKLAFLDNSGNTIIAKPFYKLMGVDLQVNNANNAYVTLNKFNFIDRNQFVYPNTNSTLYGVFNMQYRVIGQSIEFIPTPAGGQAIRMWYIPRLEMLLKDTDTTEMSVSGWIRYVIVRAAKYALDKEESDTGKLDQELLFLKARIEASASNRDAGQPDTISNTRGRNGTFGGNWGSGWGGFGGDG